MTNLIQEIIDRFAAADETPGDDWAFADDNSSFGLDHRMKDGTKFWIDLNADGEIVILWKTPGEDKPRIIRYQPVAK